MEHQNEAKKPKLRILINKQAFMAQLYFLLSTVNSVATTINSVIAFNSVRIFWLSKKNDTFDDKEYSKINFKK